MFSLLFPKMFAPNLQAKIHIDFRYMIYLTVLGASTLALKKWQP
jgi:hypothetical protein